MITFELCLLWIIALWDCATTTNSSFLITRRYPQKICSGNNNNDPNLYTTLDHMAGDPEGQHALCLSRCSTDVTSVAYRLSLDYDCKCKTSCDVTNMANHTHITVTMCKISPFGFNHNDVTSVVRDQDTNTCLRLNDVTINEPYGLEIQCTLVAHINVTYMECPVNDQGVFIKNRQTPPLGDNIGNVAIARPCLPHYKQQDATSGLCFITYQCNAEKPDDWDTVLIYNPMGSLCEIDF